MSGSNFAWIHKFRDLLHAAIPQHGTNGFTSPLKEGVLKIFFAPKIRRLWPGLKPQTWVLKASTLPLDHQSRTVLKFEISMMLGRLTHKCTPPQQVISVILHEKVVQLHINLIYANSFQECTDSTNREIPAFWQWKHDIISSVQQDVGKNQNSGLLIPSWILISIYTRRFVLLWTPICYTNVRSTLIYSHKFCKAPNIVDWIPISCCEFDIYTKLSAHSDAVTPALQSPLISTKTLKILTFLHESREKFRTLTLHVKKMNLSKFSNAVQGINVNNSHYRNA